MRCCLLLLLSTACYTYAPLDPASAQPGTEVRARVSARSAEQIATLLGTTDARLLTGTVVRAGPDTLLVEVPTAARVASAGGTVTLHQRIGLARPDVLELEQRTFSRARTTIVVGAAALVASSYLLKTLVFDRGRERVPTDPGGPELQPWR